MLKLFVVEDGTESTDVIRGALAELPDVHVEQLTVGEVLSRLAANEKRTPIVVVCEERFLDPMLAAGACECVATPVRPRELAARVRAVLRDRDRSRERDLRERRKSDMIKSLRREKESLERIACVDALTGIANRRHALAMLDAEWKRSLRDHSALGVVMVDLDCYHQYNEQYGHLAGDKCLQLVSEAMVGCLRRPSDYLGRYGGEEFVAVLPGTDAVGAKLVAERMRAAVEALAIPHRASSCGHTVTLSAGFASLRVTPDLAMDRLIAAADAALLRAKAQGRNRVEGEAPLVRPSRVSAHRWQRFEPVHADPWFADRIPTFLAAAHAGARAMMDGLGNDEVVRLEHTAKMLRATARDLGLTIIDRLVGEYDRAALAVDAERARAAADELIEYVTHVQVIYRRRGDGGALVAR